MRIPKTSVRTTWRADWLTEFSTALLALALLTREIILGAVGLGILFALGSLGLIFHLRLGIMRRELIVEHHLSKTRVFLGDTVDGELIIRNRSQLAAYIFTIRPIVDKLLRSELSSSSSFNQVLRPGSTSSSKFTIVPLARGRFQISGFIFAFTEARGLFTEEVMFGQTSWLEVYPGTRTQMPVTPLRLYGGSPDISRKAPAGMDYAGIREYMSGDEYHRVEWKATARLRTLMVKEFHPETQMTLQILIDAGRTMHQQSYVGTKLDEALGVAQLIVESAVGSGVRIGIWLYNETDIVGAIKPATAEEQLVSLRELALTPRVQAGDREPLRHLPPPRALRRATSTLLRGERVTTFLRSLQLKLGLSYRKTGLYRVLAEASSTGLEHVLILLTDLTENGSILEVALSRREKVVVAQIGAAWRLCDGLEEAYRQYQSNSRTLKHLERLGLAVFDLRPDRLVDEIAHVTRSYGFQ